MEPKQTLQFDGGAFSLGRVAVGDREVRDDGFMFTTKGRELGKPADERPGEFDERFRGLWRQEGVA